MRKNGWYLAVPAVFIYALNASLAKSPSAAFFHLGYWLLLYSIFRFLRTVNLDRVFPLGVAGSATLLFLYGILQKIWLFPHYLSWLEKSADALSRSMAIRVRSGRVFAVFTLPTLYALICSVLVIYILHFLIHSRGRVRIGWAILLIAGLINLILTQSFGSVIHLSAGILIYLFLSGVLNLKTLAPALMVISLFLSVITGLRFSEAKRLDPVRLRVSNWTQAGRLIQANPWFGIGMGNYATEVSRVTYEGEARSIYAHNFFLQEIAETGLIFNFFLLALFWIQRHRLRLKNPRLSPHHLAAAGILLMYNLMDIGVYFFSAGLIAAIVLSQIYRDFSRNPRGTGLLFILPFAFLLLAQNLSQSALQEGRIYLSRQNLNDAHSYFEKSLNWNPWNHRALMGTGVVHFLNNRLEAAERSFEDALQIHPDAPYAHYLLSQVYARREQFQDALYHASRAARSNPNRKNYAHWYEKIETLFAKAAQPAGK